MIIPSNHARKRIKERCGVGKGSVDRICELVDVKGVDKEYTKGMLRKWLDQKCRDKHSVKVFGDKAFLISEESVLVTVLQIPQSLMKNKGRMIIPA